MKTLLTTALLLIFSVSCSAVNPASKPSKSSKQIQVQTGKASWYSTLCNGGSKTASGERLNNNSSTAAHKTLPMGTKVKVTNVRNGKSEIVKISDRGPYVKGRVIDVTVGVASRLGFKSQGVTDVKVEVLQ
jgi:rare lipoprotein A